MDFARGWILLLVFGFLAAYFILATAIKVAQARQGNRPKRYKWTIVVYACLALSAALLAPSDLFDSDLYSASALASFGVSAMLITTIPCGIPFFNRKLIRPFRNMYFIAIGGLLIFDAINMVH